MKINLRLIQTVLLFFFIFNKSFAQNVGINSTGAAPDPSSMLDVVSTTKGLLIPRVSLFNTIFNTPIGPGITTSLLVYNIASSGAGTAAVTPGYYYWNGTNWVRFAGTTTSWQTTGNFGTTSGTNFLGTTDAQALDFRTNNIIRTRITTKGQIETYNTGQSVFIGEGAGNNDDLTNKQNNFIGYQAAMANTSGSINIAFGGQALFNNTTGKRNIAIGNKTLFNSNTTKNIAIGHNAAQAINSGTANIVIGDSAYFSDDGNSNVVIGNGAAKIISGGINQNVVIGADAGRNMSGGNGLVFCGYNAGNKNQADYCTFVGHESGLHNTAGTNNTFLGAASGYSNTIGDENVYVGSGAGASSPDGYRQTGVGAGVLLQGKNGWMNTALGYYAGYFTGATTPVSLPAEYNTFVGGNAGAGIDKGYENTAIGAHALTGWSFTGFENLSGCTALGYKASGSAGTGLDFLTSIGAYSDVKSKSGTVVGYQAMVSPNSPSATAVGNLATATGTNATAIGNGANSTVSNNMVFGNTAVVGWGFGVAPGASAIKVGTAATNGNGASLTLAGVWTNASDSTKKYQIKPLNYGLKDVIKLKPVSYKMKITGQKDIGFLAQEVKQVIPEIVYGDEGQMTLSYGQLTSVLTKAVQELNVSNETLKSENENLKKLLEQLNTRIEKLEKK